MLYFTVTRTLANSAPLLNRTETAPCLPCTRGVRFRRAREKENPSAHYAVTKVGEAVGR